MIDYSSYVFLFIILVINSYAYFIANKYFNMSIDIYNHKAFINSINNNYIIPSSAIRESNTYPPLIHLFYNALEHNGLNQYFSFTFFILNQVVALCIGFYLFDFNLAVVLLLISSLSTSLILDVRTYNARILGVFMYNLLFLFILLSFKHSLFFVPLQVVLCVLIIFSSRFAHQMIWFVVLPSSMILGVYEFLFSYLISVVLLFYIFNGHGIKIIKGHVEHLRYYFFNGVEFWAFQKYWREFGCSVSNDKKKNEKLLSVLKLFKIFLRQPVTILMAVFIFLNTSFSSPTQLLEYKFSLFCFLSGFVFYLATAFSDKVNKFIGDGFRYWEYLLIPFGAFFCIANSNSLSILEFKVILGVISILVLIVTHRDLKNVSKNIYRTSRVENENLNNLCKELDSLKYDNILTLPISLSNVLSVNTTKKYFYAYTFFGFWFLNRKGIFPWFKRGNENLLNKSYVNYLVIDRSQVDELIEAQLIIDYKLTYLFESSLYVVYKK